MTKKQKNCMNMRECMENIEYIPTLVSDISVFVG